VLLNFSPKRRRISPVTRSIEISSSPRPAHSMATVSAAGYSVSRSAILNPYSESLSATHFASTDSAPTLGPGARAGRSSWSTPAVYPRPAPPAQVSTSRCARSSPHLGERGAKKTGRRRGEGVKFPNVKPRPTQRTLDALLAGYAVGTWVVLDPGMSKVLGSAPTPAGAMRKAHIPPDSSGRTVGKRPVMLQVPDLSMSCFF